MQPRQPAPVKPKKKRVRRETIEMQHLLEQTRKLELRLEQQKKRSASASETRSGRRPQRQTDENDHRSHLNLTTAHTMWEGLAERQINERMRAEWQKKTLQVAHSAQMKYALELGKQLRHIASDKALTALSTRKQAVFWDLSSCDDADIFAEQLTQVARVYLMWARQLLHPSTTLHFRSDLSKGEELVKLNPDVDAGVVFEMHCGTTVPFDLQVAAQAYWRIEERDFTTRVRGKQTCRRHVSEDSVTIVWTGSADPVEMSGAKFRGMQCQKSGWIELRRVDSQGSGRLASGRATTVEMHSEMTPLFQPGVVDQGRQISALIGSLRKSHDQTNAIYCQMLQELLLEEDWKATFGSDMLVF
ncbi:hypothetical protein BBJ28_00008045 [Nothophytophthora sp. Chile5]|nr:hypothetical protein BBJ28_00008045 [Nothophytophthora sp. Chile5]